MNVRYLAYLIPFSECSCTEHSQWNMPVSAIEHTEQSSGAYKMAKPVNLMTGRITDWMSWVNLDLTQSKCKKVAPILWCLMETCVSSWPVKSLLHFCLLHFSESLETSLLWCHKRYRHVTDVLFQLNKTKQKYLTVNTIACMTLQMILNLKCAVAPAHQNLYLLTQSHSLYSN